MTDDQVKYKMKAFPLRNEIEKVKKEKPDIDHEEALKIARDNWKNSIKNWRNEHSPYNDFMREEIAKVKTENPKLDHKEAFKLAARNWNYSIINPKNQHGVHIPDTFFQG